MQPREGPEAPSGFSRPSPGDPSRERVLEIAHDLGFDLCGIGLGSAARRRPLRGVAGRGPPRVDGYPERDAPRPRSSGAWPEGSPPRPARSLAGPRRAPRRRAHRAAPQAATTTTSRQAPAQAAPAARGRGSRASRPGLRRRDAAPGAEPRRRCGPGLRVEGRQPAPSALRPVVLPGRARPRRRPRADLRRDPPRLLRDPRRASMPARRILEPGVVDSRLCISYATIEHRARSPRGARGVGPWAFGCDVCSEVSHGIQGARPGRAVRLRPDSGRACRARRWRVSSRGERPVEGREALFAEAFRGHPRATRRDSRTPRLAGAPADRGREAPCALERAAEPSSAPPPRGHWPGHTEAITALEPPSTQRSGTSRTRRRRRTRARARTQLRGPESVRNRGDLARVGARQGASRSVDTAPFQPPRPIRRVDPTGRGPEERPDPHLPRTRPRNATCPLEEGQRETRRNP